MFRGRRVCRCRTHRRSRPVFAQSKAKAQNVPRFRTTRCQTFRSSPGPVPRRGHRRRHQFRRARFVYTRSGETRLFEFDQNGDLRHARSAQGIYGFAFAHSVRVDAQDNIWAVDEGTNMIVKFSPDGTSADDARPAARSRSTSSRHAGRRRLAPAATSRTRSTAQTDVGWDPQGNIFVSDGYGDARVVKYDKNGRFIKSVGTRATARCSSARRTRWRWTAQGNVYVGDRGNARVQVLDNDLNFKAIYDKVGNPWAVCVSRRARTSTCTCRTRGPTAATRAPRRTPARSTRWSSTARSSASSARPARRSKEFSTIHQIDCRNPNEIFIAEITDWRVAEDHAAPAAGR